MSNPLRVFVLGDRSMELNDQQKQLIQRALRGYEYDLRRGVIAANRKQDKAAAEHRAASQKIVIGLMALFENGEPRPAVAAESDDDDDRAIEVERKPWRAERTETDAAIDWIAALTE